MALLDFEGTEICTFNVHMIRKSFVLLNGSQLFRRHVKVVRFRKSKRRNAALVLNAIPMVTANGRSEYILKRRLFLKSYVICAFYNSVSHAGCLLSPLRLLFGRHSACITLILLFNETLQFFIIHLETHC